MSLVDKEVRLLNMCCSHYPLLEKELLKAKAKIKSQDTLEPPGELQNFYSLIVSDEAFLRLADDDFDDPTISLSDLLNTKPVVRVETVVDFLHRWPRTFYVKLYLSYQHHKLDVHTAEIGTVLDWKPSTALLLDLFNTFKYVRGLHMNSEQLKVIFTFR